MTDLGRQHLPAAPRSTPRRPLRSVLPASPMPLPHHAHTNKEEPVRTVQVRVVLQLVSEERAGDVDLLTSDDGDLLAGEDLLERRE